MKNEKTLVIAGPTGAGKTAVSIELAQMINGEIVSADSIQVYKYMDIGSAKATLQERTQIPHHMIDVVDPRENYSVAEYYDDAKKCIEEIQARGKTPILVGGTGLYIKAVTSPMDFANTPGDEEYRVYLRRFVEQNGVDALHNMLAKVDPDAAQRIHKNNAKRVIRALEVNKLTGKPLQAYENVRNAVNDEKVAPMIRLTLAKEQLYERINRRVDQMMEKGFVEEVQGLLNMGCDQNGTAMQGLGYKQLVMYLNNEISLQETVEAIKQETRRYAKRQNTWFKREPMIPIDISGYSGMKQLCLDIITKTGINS